VYACIYSHEIVFNAVTEYFVIPFKIIHRAHVNISHVSKSFMQVEVWDGAISHACCVCICGAHRFMTQYVDVTMGLAQTSRPWMYTVDSLWHT
jgi:hypothetical protein